MANICNNQIRYICKNEITATQIAQTINSVIKDSNWELSDLCDYYKIPADVFTQQPNMRSNVTVCYASDNQVIITSESKWSPAVAVFREIANQIKAIEKVYYTSEEPGFDIFVSNDPEYEDCYFVDTDYDVEYIHTLKDTAQYVRDILDEHHIQYDKHLSNNDLLSFANENMDTYISVHPYTHVSIQDQT